MVLTSANKDVRKLAEGRADLPAMTDQYTKWSVEVTHPEQVPSVIRRAFNEARTPAHRTGLRVLFRERAGRRGRDGDRAFRRGIFPDAA